MPVQTRAPVASVVRSGHWSGGSCHYGAGHWTVPMVHLHRLSERLGLTGAGVARACTVLLVLALAATITGWALEFAGRRSPSEPVRSVPTGNAVARTQPADIAPAAQLFGARAGGEGA